MPRLSWQDFLFLKPNCLEGSKFFFSIHHSRREWMSFSMSFRRQEVREIGLYFPGEFFGIKKTIECCQDSGNVPSVNRLLSMFSNTGKYCSGKMEIIL